jgi:hypothetical protein
MIPLQTGVCTHIGLRKTISKREPYPHSSCQDLANYHSELYDKFINLNKTYTQQVCYQLCRQKKMVDACNCSVKNYPNVDDWPVCNTQEQLDCFDSNYLSVNNLTGCDELCPLECDSVYYDYTTVVEPLPSDSDFYERVRNDERLVEVFKEKRVELNERAILDSVACFYVYYEQMSQTRIEESPTVTTV